MFYREDGVLPDDGPVYGIEYFECARNFSNIHFVEFFGVCWTGDFFMPIVGIPSINVVQVFLDLSIRVRPGVTPLYTIKEYFNMSQVLIIG